MPPSSIRSSDRCFACLWNGACEGAVFVSIPGKQHPSPPFCLDCSAGVPLLHPRQPITMAARRLWPCLPIDSGQTVAGLPPPRDGTGEGRASDLHTPQIAERPAEPGVLLESLPMRIRQPSKSAARRCARPAAGGSGTASWLPSRQCRMPRSGSARCSGHG